MGREELVYMIIGCVIFIPIAGIIIWSFLSEKRYMKKQKETGEDKRAVLELMAQVMEDAYTDYTYMIGYDVQHVYSGNTDTRYLLPYILAYNASQVIVFGYIKKKGKLYIRNRLPIDWSNTQLKAVVHKKFTEMIFSFAGSAVRVELKPVIVSNGDEATAFPVGVYQEQEYERLKSYLPQYREYAKK